MKLALKKIYSIFLRIKRRDCSFGRRITLSPSCSFEGRNKIDNGAYLSKFSIGYGSYIGENGIFVNAQIGRYSCIGNNVHMIVGRHPTRDFVSIHPAFFSIHNSIGFSYVSSQKFEEVKHVNPMKNSEGKDLIIGNDVWIGSNVNLLDGVAIGDGAIVAAGSLVVEDVKPYSIVGGVPAKEIKKRFTENDIGRLLKIRWWDRETDFIAKHADDFENLERFYRIFDPEDQMSFTYGENKNEI